MYMHLDSSKLGKETKTNGKLMSRVVLENVTGVLKRGGKSGSEMELESQTMKVY